MEVTLYGTRGSCPCGGHRYGVYGGNTSCGLVRTLGGTPIILDLGTGLRMLGQDLLEESCEATEPLVATVLLTHLHFDHIFGLPFFGPLLLHGAMLDVYGPSQEGRTLADAVSSLFSPPFFPLELDHLGGRVTFHDIGDEDFSVGDTNVSARRVPHLGNTLGFRVEGDGRSMAYVPDHQAPRDQQAMPETVLELCDHADLVVHDAQYSREDFEQKWNWGHSTVDFAVGLAAEAAARRLLLFHHDPSRDDSGVAELEDRARALRRAGCLAEVSAAQEGVAIDLGAR